MPVSKNLKAQRLPCPAFLTYLLTFVLPGWGPSGPQPGVAVGANTLVAARSHQGPPPDEDPGFRLVCNVRQALFMGHPLTHINDLLR